MSGLSSKTLINPQSAIRNPQLPKGFTLLDLLITLLVLALILLAAVKQFGVYQQSAPQPTQPAASAPAK
jgi:prepilin-type N-terminal cleavage/methylation domain-containing protein